MHKERSVLGCIPLLHRISFVFDRAIRPGCHVHKCGTLKVIKNKRKTLKIRVLSVCPDDTFPEYREKLYFTRNVQTTESGMK